MATKPRYNLNLRIFEQPVPDPKTAAEAEANKNPIEVQIPPKDRVIRGRNIDTCRRMAREYAENVLKRRVRTVSIGPDGLIVMVYGQGVKLPIGEPVSEKALTKGLAR